jgi:PAS domain S-box-containing protein
MTTLRIHSLCAVLVVACLSSAPATAAPKSVLTIYSQARESANIAAYDEGLYKSLRAAAGGDVSYYAEFMDSTRFSGESHVQAVRDYLSHKYAGRQIDALVLVGKMAADAIAGGGGPVFPNVPVLFYTLDEFASTVPSGAVRLVGSFGPDQRQTLELALSLHPGTRRVYVVVQTPAEGPPYSANIQREFAPIEKRIPIEYLSEMPTPEVIAALKRAPADSIVMFVRQNRNLAGLPADPRDVLKLLTESVRLPIYGGFDTYLGFGVLGGYLYSSERNGAVAGTLAWRLANGERVDTAPENNAKTVPVFDARQLQRWNIRDSQLPAGSIVRFREPSFWARYQRYGIAALTIFLFQLVLIGLLLAQLNRRRRAELARSESEIRTGAILRAMPDLMFLMARDGTYLDYHAREPRDLFAPPEYFLGKTMYDVMPPQLAATFAAAIEKTAGSGEPAIVEYQLPLEQGERFFEGRIVSCGPDRVLSIVRDITDQKRAEERFEVSEERYALATAAGGVGVWDWHVATEELYIDPSVLGLLGQDAPPDHRVNWRELVHPQDQEATRAAVFSCLDSGNPPCDIEHRMLHADGSVRWFHTRGSVVLQPDGKPYRVVGTFTDITSRKRVEAALRAGESNLRASYAEIQNLAGRLIAAQETEHKRLARELHDHLSQKLALLSMDVEQLAQDAPDFASRVERVAARAGEIAGDVHALSHRLHPFKLEALGLVAAMRRVCTDVAEQHGLDVEFHHEGVADHLAADVALSLFRIVQEALHNVVKHSRSPRASVRLEQRGSDVTLQIADSGIGFDPESRESAGLGLVSMRERVNFMGGQMVIHSTPGSGTRIGVRVSVQAEIGYSRPAAFGSSVTAESA